MSAVPKAIVIDLPLPVGSTLTINGHRWEVLDVEPYERRDGTASHIVTWAALCVDCGQEFAEKAGGSVLPRLSKRCPECRGGAFGHSKKKGA